VKAWQEQVDVAVPVEVGQDRPAIGVDLGARLVVTGRENLGRHVVKIGARANRGAPVLGVDARQPPFAFGDPLQIED